MIVGERSWDSGGILSDGLPWSNYDAHTNGRYVNWRWDNTFSDSTNSSTEVIKHRRGRYPRNGENGQKVFLKFSEVLGRDEEVRLKLLQRDGVILPARQSNSSHRSASTASEMLKSIDFKICEKKGILTQLLFDNFPHQRVPSNAPIRGWSNSPKCIRGNFMETPTECPARELAGWTDDIELLSLAAALLSDVQAHIRRYLSNLALEEYSNVAFPLLYEVKHHPAQEV